MFSFNQNPNVLANYNYNFLMSIIAVSSHHYEQHGSTCDHKILELDSGLDLKLVQRNLTGVTWLTFFQELQVFGPTVTDQGGVDKTGEKRITTVKTG